MQQEAEETPEIQYWGLEFHAWTKTKAVQITWKSWKRSEIQDFAGIYSSEVCLGMIDEG